MSTHIPCFQDYIILNIQGCDTSFVIEHLGFLYDKDMYKIEGFWNIQNEVFNIIAQV